MINRSIYIWAQVIIRAKSDWSKNTTQGHVTESEQMVGTFLGLSFMQRGRNCSYGKRFWFEWTRASCFRGLGQKVCAQGEEGPLWSNLYAPMSWSCTGPLTHPVDGSEDPSHWMALVVTTILTKIIDGIICLRWLKNTQWEPALTHAHKKPPNCTHKGSQAKNWTKAFLLWGNRT